MTFFPSGNHLTVVLRWSIYLRAMRTQITLFALVVLDVSLVLGQSQTPAAPAAGPQAPERIAADTPKTTVMGNMFVAPKDWMLTVKGPATILEAPEGGSGIALVDIAAKDAD